MTEKRPDWVADFKAHSDPEADYDDDFHYEYYITEETIQWALKIATKTLNAQKNLTWGSSPWRDDASGESFR